MAEHERVDAGWEASTLWKKRHGYTEAVWKARYTLLCIDRWP